MIYEVTLAEKVYRVELTQHGDQSKAVVSCLVVRVIFKRRMKCGICQF